MVSNCNIGKFDLRDTHILKALAIILVIISHFFRYANPDAKLSYLRSVGFFGAALFAFLSGYGVSVAYKNKGFSKHWLLRKCTKVYFPFLFVTVLSIVFIYKDHNLEWNGMANRILLGSDDFAMWYIPYILLFYIVFRFVFSRKIGQSKQIILFCIICIAQIILGKVVGVSSQWYTSTGSLCVGVIIGMHNNLVLQLKQCFIGYWVLGIGYFHIVNFDYNCKPLDFQRFLHIDFRGFLFIGLILYHCGMEWGTETLQIVELFIDEIG
jgi:uncharacterized membrane protein